MSVQMSAVMILLPRMVNLFMEGLAPIGSAASEYMFSKMGDDADILIGMDICLGLGDPCALTATVIMLPLVIGMAFILPINYFPVGVLASVCYQSVMPTAVTKGNVFRTLLLMIVYYAFTMYVTAQFVPQATAFLENMGVEGITNSASTYMANPYAWIAMLLAKIF